MAKTSYTPNPAKIKVVGIGGAGCNAITRMVREQIRGVELIAMNSDAQHLAITEVEKRVQLGERVTRGLGSNGDRALGQKAAEESRDEIESVLSGSDIVFIVAGMGGGTGTGASPVVADIAKLGGALTIGIVTRPFTFEGTARSQVAKEGILVMLEKVDALILLSNDRLLELLDPKTGVDTAFKLIDDTMCQTVRAITEVVTVPGLINLDFADVKAIMKDAGLAQTSIGRGFGQNRAADAAKQAVTSPILEVPIEHATGILFEIAASSSFTLFEANNAAEVIRQAAAPDANIIFGIVLDPNMGDEVRLTLIATGLVAKDNKKAIAVILQEKDIRRLLKDATAEELEIPSFFRRTYPRRPKPLPAQEPLVDYTVLAKGYSIFNSRLNDDERSLRLKQLRDQEVKNNPQDIAVDLLNSMWRLSQDISSVPDYSSVMIRLLQSLPSAHEMYPLYNYYLFISSACATNSAQDFGRLPLRYLEIANQLSKEIPNTTNIPVQMSHLCQLVRSQVEKDVPETYTNRLKRAKDVLWELTVSLKSERQTPEAISLSYVLNRWLQLVSEAIKISLSHIKCTLATQKPTYLNRPNEIQIKISGGMPGQSLQMSTPVTQNYDVRLHDASAILGDNGTTTIGLQVTPYAQGAFPVLIEIEGFTFQVEVLVLPENPFIVGTPVQTEEMFVGRQDIVNRIIRGIVAPHPTNFLITGRRRIGKTSVLYAIKRKLPKGILPVLISTETCGKSPMEVCHSLANEVAGAILETQSTWQWEEYAPEILESDPPGSFISWLRKLQKRLSSSSLYGMVLLIDEALDVTEWDDRVQRLLRYILSSMTWIRGVLAGPPDIIERMTEQISSPLYNIFTTVKLGPIDLNDTYQLVAVPLQRCGIEGVQDMLLEIYDYSGGIPYYIQAIGHEIIEDYFQRNLTGRELLSRSLTRVREGLKTSYPVTLRRLSPEQKVAIVSVASGVNPPEVSARRLEQADLIEKEGSKWLVRARIEREWVKEYVDQLLDSAGQELWATHKKEIDLMQLANDLRKIKEEFANSGEISEALASAISAAEKGNGAKTLKHLGKVGQWILDTATRIGAEVAAAAIKRIYGLS